MTNRQPIQFLLQTPPLRQKLVNVGDKSCVVAAFQQVNHFMHHNVF